MVRIGDSSRNNRTHRSSPLSTVWTFRLAIRLSLVVIATICLFLVSSVVEHAITGDDHHLNSQDRRSSLEELWQATKATAEAAEQALITRRGGTVLDDSTRPTETSHRNAVEEEQQPIAKKNDPSSPQRSVVIDAVTGSTATTEKAITIGYAVVITGCSGSDNKAETPFPIAEGGAVLKHSIERASIRQNGGSYDYQLYAIYHPAAVECASTLAPLGFIMLERETPVPVAEIQGKFLREKIVKNGCCGEKELLKFEAYTLIEHPLIVLLDLDVLLLKPMDTMFDLMLQDKVPEDKAHHFMWPDQPLPTDIQVLYTRDYAMVNPGRHIKPFQGGFAVLRPNMTVYDEFVSIIRKGDFRERGGWGGQSGKFWGAQTFQGLMPYYYHILHPGRAVELNWCTYNNMGSPSRDDGVVDDKAHGKCFNNQEVCEDCRNRDVDQIVSVHFTVCQKPWLCMSFRRDGLQQRLCKKIHHAWFQARSEMESSWGRPAMGEGKFDREQTLGYCNSYGKKGYRLIEEPYGNLVESKR